MEWVIIIGIVAVVWIAIVQGNNAQRQKDAAQRAYRNSLESLKKTPTDADLKQSTLALGRFYSNLTRDKKGNTVFDEMALMNDISAACAAATERPSPATAIQGTVEDRLAKLSKLLRDGLIDEADYARRKGEILHSV